jgi:ParB-like chromosome segregation protein Spo0J
MLVLTVASLGASAPFFKDTMQTHNPADQVVRWDISLLTPYARNSRSHSDQQINQIAASIKEWGWTTPVLIDEDGGIIAGHGRVLAAQKLKIDLVPVIVAKGWSESKKRAYVIADNKLAINASWDEEMLRLELAELDVAGFNLELTGFTGDDLTQAMFGNEALDVTPESSSQEIDVDDYKMGHQCPKCGFEFDEKT